MDNHASGSPAEATWLSSAPLPPKTSSTPPAQSPGTPLQPGAPPKLLLQTSSASPQLPGEPDWLKLPSRAPGGHYMRPQASSSSPPSGPTISPGPSAAVSAPDGIFSPGQQISFTQSVDASSPQQGLVAMDASIDNGDAPSHAILSTGTEAQSPGSPQSAVQPPDSTAGTAQSPLIGTSSF